MTVHDSSAVAVPTDRIVMVWDGGLWEFALWDQACHLRPDGSLGAGWCVADHETLRWSVISDDTVEVAVSVIEAPSHWMEVPADPVASLEDHDASENVLTD